MEIFHGIGSSNGIAIGKTLIINSAFARYPRIELDSEEEIQQEIQRIRKAQKLTERQLKTSEKESKPLLPTEMHSIFELYRFFIRDKRLVPATEEKIRSLEINAEWALIHVITDLKEQFDIIKDPYIKSRYDDLRQIAERLMNNLLQKPHLDLARLKEPVVLCCHDISPADAIMLSKRNVLGIATEMGGETSHSTIVARALGIPAVVGIDHITTRMEDNQFVILDGTNGLIISDPDEATFRESEEKIYRRKFFEKKLQELATLDCQLSDGQKVNIAANLDFLEELKRIKALNINSIGLIRTEFLFLNENALPDEETQFKLYKSIVSEMGGKLVTFRTWDIGADKMFRMISLRTDESNPALGLRAIRYCLKHQEEFRAQLRALIRASDYGPIRIMIPMITTFDEMTSTKKILEEEKEKLNIQDTGIELGCMIETPASALIIDELLDICNFISIGCNDLVQYTLAIDRMNEHVAYLYAPFHPSILRLMERVVVKANQLKVPVSICGEMAADPFMQMFLIGIGKVTFSMSPNRVLITKQILRKVTATECKKMAFRFLSKRTLIENKQYLQELRKKYLKDIEF